ncbi:hypothetical protein L1887_10593 [Cichorium endivia]|nr:hypothetical protein L1887_10593 [Cichorium endivia]
MLSWGEDTMTSIHDVLIDVSDNNNKQFYEIGQSSSKSCLCRKRKKEKTYCGHVHSACSNLEVKSPPTILPFPFAFLQNTAVAFPFVLENLDPFLYR